MTKTWRVTVWGTRGSIPVAGADFLEYGGNTTCISVDCGEEFVIFDAGSGLTRLGYDLSRRGIKKVHLLLSHLHMDHVIGLFGFQLLHNPEAEIHLYGEARNGVSFEKQLERLVGAPYWPLGLHDFRAHIIIHEIRVGDCLKLSDQDSLLIRTMRGNHPNQCLLYRLENAAKSVVHSLDCEMNDEIFSALADFARDCDLFILDANFIRTDLQPGWGHSTWEQGIALRHAANAGMALMTHYNWEYTDNFLREQERLALQADPASRFARENMKIEL